MRITDFVKPGMMNRSHIEAAEQMLSTKESVLYAFNGNCRTSHGASNRLIVLTGHRLLFVAGIVKPPQCDSFSLGDCIGIGDISGGLVKKQDYVCSDIRITVEGTKEQLQALTEKTLAAIEAYPNQPAIDFPSRPVAGPAVVPKEKKTPAAPQTQRSVAEAHMTKKEQAKQRIKENRSAGIACCPKCGSTSLSANKKGFSLGKAAAGAFVAGPVGLVGGTMGANKLEITCLNCGHKFKPGK